MCKLILYSNYIQYFRQGHNFKLYWLVYTTIQHTARWDCFPFQPATQERVHTENNEVIQNTEEQIRLTHDSDENVPLQDPSLYESNQLHDDAMSSEYKQQGGHTRVNQEESQFQENYEPDQECSAQDIHKDFRPTQSTHENDQPVQDKHETNQLTQGDPEDSHTQSARRTRENVQPAQDNFHKNDPLEQDKHRNNQLKNEEHQAYVNQSGEPPTWNQHPYHPNFMIKPLIIIPIYMCLCHSKY